MRSHGPIDVVEACYQLEGTRAQWLRRVVDSLMPLMDSGLGAHGYIARRRGVGQFDLLEELFLCHEHARNFVRRMLAENPPEVQEYQFRLQAPVDVAHETMAIAGREAAKWYYRCNPPGGRILDHVGLMARDGSDEVLGVMAFSQDRIEVSAKERRRFRLLLAHMSAGWRLQRTALDLSEEAVLGTDGRCLHARGVAKHNDARESLRHAVRTLDQVRGPLRRKDEGEALSLWNGLVAGRWSLVDRFESDGRRYIIAHRNEPRYEDPRKLTRREQQCARLAGLGYSNAEIGYALGRSASTVGTHVHAALCKLGLSRRQELAEALEPVPLADTHVTALDPDERLKAMGAPSAPPLPPDVPLSPSERDVAEALLQGASLREIADRRGTSERTVANQLQRIYRKFDVDSRNELVAWLRFG